MQNRIVYSRISWFLGIVGFVPLIMSLLVGGSVSFVSFLLWSVIASINAYSTKREHGNYFFSLALAIGNFITAIVALFMGRVMWSWIEWLTLFLVLICLYFWLRKSNTQTIIISSVAITIGGVPQLVLAWFHADRIAVTPWLIFLAASFFGIIAGRDWSVKERLYSTLRFLYYLALLIVVIVKS